MDRADDDRLIRLLGDPELAWLLDRVRRRLELDQDLDVTVTLTGASLAQRAAVHRLLGRAPRAGRTLGVPLPVLDALIRRSGACADGLAGASVRLGGPISRRADADRALAALWEGAFAGLERTVAGTRLVDWLAELRACGLVKRLAPDPLAARALLDRLARVLAALPAQGEPLGHFAARVGGSAHALDDGEPLATLALGAARALAGSSAHRDGESRRETWAAVGVLRDAVSSLVLCAGLAGDAASVTGRILAAGAEGGQPVVLTLRQLVCDPPDWTRRERNVHVCENPVLLELAADRLGRDCPPLVCTSGQPGAAVMALLRGLAQGGARLRHHGDFDWGGLRIGNVLHTRLAIEPWRFDAAAYRRAAATYSGPPLRGAPTAASWDGELADAMLTTGYAIEEESVAESLLEDLEAAA